MKKPGSNSVELSAGTRLICIDLSPNQGNQKKDRNANNAEDGKSVNDGVYCPLGLRSKAHRFKPVGFVYSESVTGQ